MKDDMSMAIRHAILALQALSDDARKKRCAKCLYSDGSKCINVNGTSRGQCDEYCAVDNDSRKLFGLFSRSTTN